MPTQLTPTSVVFNDSTSQITAAYTAIVAGSGIGITGTLPSITVANTGVTALTAGSGISVSGATGNVTISLAGGSAIQLTSLGVGTAASGTTGEIRATNNITAFFSSDQAFKENIQSIPHALEIAAKIGGKYFDWTDGYLQKHGGEDGYFLQKHDFGMIAQDVEKHFPRAVRRREDGTLALDYQKMSALAFQALFEVELHIVMLQKMHIENLQKIEALEKILKEPS